MRKRACIHTPPRLSLSLNLVRYDEILDKKIEIIMWYLQKGTVCLDRVVKFRVYLH